MKVIREETNTEKDIKGIWDNEDESISDKEKKNKK